MSYGFDIFIFSVNNSKYIKQKFQDGTMTSVFPRAVLDQLAWRPRVSLITILSVILIILISVNTLWMTNDQNHDETGANDSTGPIWAPP